MDPSLELQGAIVARLKASAGVTAIVGQRVYDQVPPSATFPYVTLGADQAVSDDADCITGFEISVQVDVWSRKQVGFTEAKQAAHAIRTALLGTDLSLTTNAMVSFEHRQTAYENDPDGQTRRARMTFVALVEQP